MSLPKLFITLGVILIVTGCLWHFGEKFSMFKTLGHLPGDIAIERGNSKFYFPLTTSILVSIVVSTILYLIKKLF